MTSKTLVSISVSLIDRNTESATKNQPYEKIETGKYLDCHKCVQFVWWFDGHNIMGRISTRFPFRNIIDNLYDLLKDSSIYAYAYTWQLK